MPAVMCENSNHIVIRTPWGLRWASPCLELWSLHCTFWTGQVHTFGMPYCSDIPRVQVNGMR